MDEYTIDIFIYYVHSMNFESNLTNLKKKLMYFFKIYLIMVK